MRVFHNYPGLTFSGMRAVHFWGAMVTAVAGAAFLAVSLFLPDVMSPDVYGHMAYSIPAEIWSLCWMASGTLGMVAVTKNGNWRSSSLMKTLSYMATISLYILIGLSAATAPLGAHVALFGLLIFPVAYTPLLVAAWREYRVRSNAYRQ